MARYGGRAKGTPNKNSLNAIAIAEKLKIDPLEVILYFVKNDWKSLGYKSECVTKMLKDGSTIEVERITPEMRLTAAKEAAGYIYPKRKAIEHTVEGETGGLALVIKDYTKK